MVPVMAATVRKERRSGKLNNLGLKVLIFLTDARDSERWKLRAASKAVTSSKLNSTSLKLSRVERSQYNLKEHAKVLYEWFGSIDVVARQSRVRTGH